MFEKKPLACDPKALDGLSEQLIMNHYDNNHGEPLIDSIRSWSISGTWPSPKHPDFSSTA